MAALELKMETILAEAEAAKVDARRAAVEMQARQEEMLVRALVSASRATADPAQALAAEMALKAAALRMATDPAKRERARFLWNKAIRKVLSPAAKMKRNMGSMLEKKLDKNQTVMSRVTALEETILTLTKRNVKYEAELKEATAEKLPNHRTRLQLRRLHRDAVRAAALTKEISSAILGTSVSCAVDTINSSCSLLGVK